MHKFWMVSVLLVASMALAQPIDLMLNSVAEPKRLTLTEVVGLALDNNLELKIKSAQIRLAEGEALGATSKLLPKINSKLSYETPPKTPSTTSDGEAVIGIGAQIPLLDFKALLDAKAKRESFAAAKTALQKERDALIFDVGLLYIEAVSAQALMENANEEQEIYRAQVAIFERKSKAGHARNLDIRRASFLAAKAYSEYLLKRQEFLKKIGALGKKIGVTDYFVLADVTIESPHLKKGAAIMREMASSTSEIAVLTKELSAASFSLLSEGFDFLPKVTASFESGWQYRTQMHRLMEPVPQFGSRAMLMIDLPIFSGGATFAGIKVANARKAIADFNLQSTVMERHLHLNSAIAELNDTEALATNAQLALDAANLAKESAQRMFDNNEATGLEVVEANTNHFSAKNLRANSRLGFEKAKLQVLHAIGVIGELFP